jgi:hypothetical protein
MKKFTIIETRPATYTWTYEVEAENQNEALEKVFNGEADVVETDIELNYDMDGEFEVINEQ